jgi:hypothetical protein
MAVMPYTQMKTALGRKSGAPIRCPLESYR